MSNFEEEKRCVGKCVFCPLGDADKRGVIETLKFRLSGPLNLRRELEDKKYECSLGEIGKECIVPEIYGNSLGGGVPRFYTG